MRILLPSLLTLLVAATIATFTSTAEAEDKRYWSSGDWEVYSTTSLPGGPFCMAGRRFTSTKDAGRRAGWGLGLTVKGQWGLAIGVSGAHEMAGRPVAILVDGYTVGNVVAWSQSAGGVYLGPLHDAAILSISQGQWMSVEGPFRTMRFRMTGVEHALEAVRRCSQELIAARAPSPAPRPSPPAAQQKADVEPIIGSGTGFYVSEAGHILTNAHVVQRCVTIIVSEEAGGVAKGYRRGMDTTHDLALLQIDRRPHEKSEILAWREDVQLGEEIAVYGFPYYGNIASTGTFTRGDVTALAGLGGNTAHLQISAPIQPGNSGGPVANDHGQIVGVVVGRLSSGYIAKRTGDLPQNINFAIKSAQARSFLQVHGVSVSAGAMSAPKLSGPALAAHLKAASVLIVCMGV